ncbi:MAG: putative Ig domain-containing protein [Opitutaceae bacterium]|nr:putative Ig domain-containing protein [Opitutaceae bacterium]
MRANAVFLSGPSGSSLRPISSFYGRVITTFGLLMGSFGGSAQAATEFTYAKVFDLPQKGWGPLVALVQSSNGDFYGVGSGDTFTSQGLGVIYRISRDGSRYTELRKFTGENGDGALPRSGLTLGSDGVLYGVTSHGGDTSDPSFANGLGKGVVYRINPDGSGYSVLRAFRGPPTDGAQPVGGIIQGSDGVLYGTTSYGGPPGSYGTIFRLNRDGSDYRTIKALTLYPDSSGAQPWSAMIQGSDGALYGTMASGGTSSGGTIFRINRDGTGFTVLKSLSDQTGSRPQGRLLEGRDGALYGTTSSGGPSGFSQGTVVMGGGTIFKINRDGSGFTLLKTFGRNAEMGPTTGLVQHRDGTLLGTVRNGGGDRSGGAIYKINPDGTGYAAIKAFSTSVPDNTPTTELLLADYGLYYGALGSGSIFSLTPLPAGRLANLSVRSLAGTDSDTLVVGFVLSPTPGKRLLIRGIGPTLAAFGVPGVLADPVLSLFSGSTLHSTNDDWSQAANAAQIVTVSRDLSAFTLSNGSRDAVLLPALTGGLYTVQVAGKGDSTGVALIEIYDADPAVGGRLVNVSARARVGTGDDILIAGFIISGTEPMRVLVRGVGPTLAGFGVTGVLADPQLALYGGSTLIRQNDNWNNASDIAAAAAAAGAFALPANSKDAALVATLNPGAYTAHISGVNNTTGVALVEVYELENQSVLPGSYTLVTATAGTGQGTITRNPAGLTYAAGTVVTLTAAAASGSTFAGWSGDGTGTTTRTITMDGDKSVIATFNLPIVPASYTLTTATAGNGQGTVTASPAGPTYDAGTVVTLTATAASGSTFAGWSGDGTGTTTRQVTMDSNKSVTATFNLPIVPTTYTLTTATAGNGQGTVAANPAGPTYAAGTVVTLTATAASGSTFAGWSGDGTGTTARTITMDGDKSVTATFNLPIVPTTYTLTTATAGNGQGTVAASPAGPTYAAGTVVTLTATVGSGSLFVGWSGDASATSLTTQVTMTSNKSVTATFAQISVGPSSSLRVLFGQTLTGSYDPYRRNSVVNGGTLLADGGAPFGGYTWSVSSGSALPAGVSLSADGIITHSGGTVVPGNYASSVTVSDGTRTASGSITFRITTEDTTPVGGIPGVQGMAVFAQLPLNFTLVIGRTSLDYGASLYAIFGTGTVATSQVPLTWTLGVGSRLPPGLTLDQAKGVIWGTPTTTGTYQFSVVVRGRSGETALGSPIYTIRVDP